MITHKVTKEELQEWKLTWIKYKDLIKPNRKSGIELMQYLQNNYSLTEIYDNEALNTITYNVKMNKYLSEKLPDGGSPQPKAFYLHNKGKGEKFYLPENKDNEKIWGGEITKIFVGIDLSSGYYLVEGSSMLWDELCCFQGLEDKDLENYVLVSQYINALKRFGKMNISD